jgi:hypothetical protein
LVNSKGYLKENQAFRKAFVGHPGHAPWTDRNHRDRHRAPAGVLHVQG